MFRLVVETVGPAERWALVRGVAWAAAVFPLVSCGYLAAGLGALAGSIDGAIFACMAGAAGLLTGLQDGRAR